MINYAISFTKTLGRWNPNWDWGHGEEMWFGGLAV